MTTSAAFTRHAIPKNFAGSAERAAKYFLYFTNLLLTPAWPISYMAEQSRGSQVPTDGVCFGAG